MIIRWASMTEILPIELGVINLSRLVRHRSLINTEKGEYGNEG
jgi:hypothetical protein